MCCYQVCITLGISQYLREYQLWMPLPHLLGGGREDCQGRDVEQQGFSRWDSLVATVQFSILLRTVLEKGGSGIAS